jgi:3',5'-cyclic AMP phosphodiesterase CpdA
MHIAEQLAAQAHEIKPDLLVISGDFVLRADLTGQWYTIVAYLNMLPQPQLVVPGNHDVSLFNGFYRLFSPLKRYRRFISPDINPVFTLPGLAVVGGCSAHGLTIDGGRVSRKQLAIMEQSFSQVSPETCKVAVLHHHLNDPDGAPPRRRIANINQTMRMLDRCKVDLFLCGHIHVSHVTTTRGIVPDIEHEVVISQCGTSTSRRGRWMDRGKNSFHLIEIDDQSIRIIPHFYQPGTGRFDPAEAHLFPRRSVTNDLRPAINDL